MAQTCVGQCVHRPEQQQRRPLHTCFPARQQCMQPRGRRAVYAHLDIQAGGDHVITPHARLGLAVAHVGSCGSEHCGSHARVHCTRV